MQRPGVAFAFEKSGLKRIHSTPIKWVGYNF